MQHAADALDAQQYAGFEFVLGEHSLHLATDRLPMHGTDQTIETAIRHNFDIAIRQQQVDQDAIVGLGIPHPQFTEQSQRALAGADAAKQRRQIQRAFHREAYFGVMRLFGNHHRSFDPIHRGG